MVVQNKVPMLKTLLLSMIEMKEVMLKSKQIMEIFLAFQTLKIKQEPVEQKIWYIITGLRL